MLALILYICSISMHLNECKIELYSISYFEHQIISLNDDG